MRAKLMIHIIAIFAVCFSLPNIAADAKTADPNDTSKYLDAVREFADNVLKYGRDTYGPKHTPLFVDGLNIHTHEPVKWIGHNGDRWILSNLASQQNLFRTLDGLTRITGDPKYKQAAMDAIKYAFENLRSPNGLLHWGGHVAYDVLTNEMCTGRGTYVHELKTHYPYYELMWQVDSKATKQLIENFWSAHVLNWSNLDMNRHGSMDERIESAWKHNYEGGPVFFESILPSACSFSNTGSDLFYAGSMLYKLSNDKGALVWSKRLAYRYIETRDPEIGISGSLYSRRKKEGAQLQFGDDFKGHIVLEGTLFPISPSTALALALQVRVWICQIILGDLLGPDGAEFSRWALDELTAWGKVSYRKMDNSFVPMLTDGTSLLGYTFTKDGYYGPKGTVVHAMEAGPICFWAYALAYRITGDPFMWEMARSIARGNSFGDIGISPTDQPYFETDIESSDPYALLGFLELYARLQKKPFLKIASRIGENILSDRFHMGFFVPSKEALYTKFDYVEPLAVLHLDAVINARSGFTTQVWPSRSEFGCQYDGSMETDNRIIYSQTRRTELLTLLLVAAWSGNTAEVETLISKGVDVNAHCKLDSLIFQRVWGARVGLDTFLEARLTNTTTPLHSAVEKGHKDIVELLIANDAEVNTKDATGYTPLHYAAERGLEDIVELLVAKGADVNAKNNNGQTPVDIALSRNRSGIMRLLIEKGADVSLHVAASLGDVAKVTNCMEQGSDINAKDQRGVTPLHYATRRGHKDVVEVLLANGADVDVRDRAGQTPAERALLDGHSEIVELLVSNGADVYPLYLAISMRDLDEVRRLIRDGADVNKQTYGTTAIYIAAIAGFRDITELLIDEGAEVNAGGSWNWTPLHGVAEEGHRELVELLIAKGADINAKDNQGRTPLQYAEDRGHTEIVELLKKHAVDIKVSSESKHDVTITGVSAISKDSRDYTVPVVINIENQGDCSESFDVKLIDVTDGLIIGSKTVTLSASGASGMDEVVDRIFDAEEDAENFFGQMVRIGGDANGDGYRDLLVSARDWNNTQGRSYLYYGRKGMMDENADITFTGEGIGDRFSNQSGAFGDVNGDGFDDVIIGAQGYPNGDNTGRVYIFYGGPNIDNNADVILDGETGETGWFGLIVAAGDANNDGYDDVLVTALAMNSWKGRAYLYYGGDPMDSTADKVFDGENAGDLYGRDAFMGDVDGDSCADVLIGARRWPEGTNRGRAYLYYGGLGTSMETVCDLTFTGENVGDFFGHALGIIDVDNDNFGDILIGAYGYPAGGNEGRAYLYWGSNRATFDNVADKTFDGEPHPANARFGVESGVGYANGDDYGDLLIGAYEYYNWDKRGRVYLFYGDKKGSMDTICDRTFTGSDLASRYGVEAELGDLNNDGFAEVVIGGWSYPCDTNRGRVWLYYGRPGDSTKLKFNWDTTNASPGKHLLKATIESIAGEKDISDNTVTVEVEVKKPLK